MQYFVFHNEIQKGPCELVDLRRQLREGELEATDLCWREGWAEWRPLSSVMGLVPAVAPAEVGDEGEGSEAVVWHTGWGGGPERRVVVLLVVVLFLAVAVVVLGVLLGEARERIEKIAEGEVERQGQQKAMLETARALRDPQAADEITAWITYEDPVSRRPVPVQRANVLLYPLERVRPALENLGKLADSGTGDLVGELTRALPAPLRETITDTDGVTVFTGIEPGQYALVVFAKKPGASGEVDYMWIAECWRDEHPSEAVIFSEANATTGGSGVLRVVRRK